MVNNPNLHFWVQNVNLQGRIFFKPGSELLFPYIGFVYVCCKVIVERNQGFLPLRDKDCI